MAPITNPYAKKRAPPATRDQSSSTNSSGATYKRPRSNNDTENMQHNNHLFLAKPTTFSQAFAGVQDSSTNCSHDNDSESQERAMDAATAAEQTHPEWTDQQAQAATLDANPHVLYMNPRQRGNVVLDYIRNVPKDFCRMEPDFVFSPTQCALFLSLKFHNLRKDYIGKRLADIGDCFTLRVLLVLVDVQDNAQPLRELNHWAVSHRFTLILAWTAEEAARYLETFKAYAGGDQATRLLSKRTSQNFADQVVDVLTACAGVNKSDAASLLGQFGSMQNLMTKGTTEELALVPGMGQVKVARLWEAFNKPLSRRAFLKRQQRELEEQENKKGSLSSEEENGGKNRSGGKAEEQEEKEDVAGKEHTEEKLE